MPKKAAKTAAKKSAKKAVKKGTKSKKTSVPSLGRLNEDLLGQFELLAEEEALFEDEEEEDEGALFSDGDLKAFVTSFAGPSPYDGLSDAEQDARRDAQEFAFDAMEASSKAAALKLVKKALKLDPDCVDALVLLNDLSARTDGDLLDGLEKAVAAGERWLSPKFIEKNKGDFWGLIETRPYMRALNRWAEELSAAQMRPKAIEVYERILELNPEDNQGVRYPLLGLYLTEANLAAAEKLLKQYEVDESAVFLWGRVIERLLARDLEGAGAALPGAFEANQYVALFLSGRRKPPAALPEMYEMGSEEEAVLCLFYLGVSVVKDHEAHLWLYEQCSALVSPGVQ